MSVRNFDARGPSAGQQSEKKPQSHQQRHLEGGGLLSRSTAHDIQGQLRRDILRIARVGSCHRRRRVPWR